MERIINIDNLITTVVNTPLKEALLSLLAGIILGYVFAKFKLPAPAPLVLAGVLGIVGIWAGYLLGK